MYSRHDTRNVFLCLVDPLYEDIATVELTSEGQSA